MPGGAFLTFLQNNKVLAARDACKVSFLRAYYADRSMLYRKM